MPATIRLPDAMPDVTAPTLLVVCDAHHCMPYALGGHALVAQSAIHSAEHAYTDRQDSKPGRGGASVGVGENTQVEEHRLREFVHLLGTSLSSIVKAQGIRVIYLSAPGKFLAYLKKHLPSPLLALMQGPIDGNFVKEPPLETLARFRPDLKKAMQDLRDDENFSAKKHLPK
jgi:hypothetical protein